MGCAQLIRFSGTGQGHSPWRAHVQGHRVLERFWDLAKASGSRLATLVAEQVECGPRPGTSDSEASERQSKLAKQRRRDAMLKRFGRAQARFLQQVEGFSAGRGGGMMSTRKGLTPLTALCSWT